MTPDSHSFIFHPFKFFAPDAVGLDVHLTADGEIIVHHEYCLNPETTRTQHYGWLNCSTPPPIKNLTLATLKIYDVGPLKPGTTYAHLYPMQEPADGIITNRPDILKSLLN